MKLSVALAVRNEEKNLARCLSAISEISDEIVIVDGSSTDKTVEIAKAYGAKIVHAGTPAIFHINKQIALDHCVGEWILQLDADEVVDSVLAAEIKNQVMRKSDISGYYIPRKNIFLGHWMKKGGQYPDYVMRLFKRGKGSFPCKSVHEQIVIDGRTSKLEEPLIHYSYQSVSEYWKKSKTYIRLTASEIKKEKGNGVLKCFIYCVMRPLFTFVLLFVRHKGFYDGIYGFLFAVFSAAHYPYAFYYSLK